MYVLRSPEETCRWPAFSLVRHHVFPWKSRLYIFTGSRLACCTEALHGALLAGAAEGSSRPRGGAATARALPARLPAPPAAPRSAAGRRCPPPPATAGRCSGSAGAPTGRLRAAAAGLVGPGDCRSFGGAGLARGAEISTSVAHRSRPLPSSRGGGGVASPVRISLLPPVLSPPRGTSPPLPAPVSLLVLVISPCPDKAQEPRTSYGEALMCTVRPAPGKGGRRGPMIAPHPSAEAPRKQPPPAWKAPAPPCRAFPRRAGI